MAEVDTLEQLTDRARLYRIGWKTSGGGLIIFLICVILFAIGFDKLAREIELYAICMFVFGLQWVWEYRKYSSHRIPVGTDTHVYLLKNARKNLENAWRVEQDTMKGRDKVASYVFGQISRATLPLGYLIFAPYVLIDWLAARFTLPKV